MIDHVSIAVSDLETSTSFYDRVLEPIGLKRMVTRQGAAGFGKRYPEFWLNARPGLTPVDRLTGAHVCLRAPTRRAVIAFHRAALAQGGAGGGAPGDREVFAGSCFAAFIHDPDGNKIEAVTFPRRSPPGADRARRA